MPKKNYNVAIKIVSIEARLIKPSRKNQGIGNDWTVSPQFVGWPAEQLVFVFDAKKTQVVNRAFKFKTKGRKKSSKKLDQNHGIVSFSQQDINTVIHVPFKAAFEEPDPKFKDTGEVTDIIDIPLLAKKTPQKHISKGIVKAKGGDESGAVEFTFNIEIKVSTFQNVPGSVFTEDGVEILPGTVPRSRKKSLEVLSAIALRPGVNMGYLDPITRLNINQILNTLNTQIRTVNGNISAITKFIRNNTLIQGTLKNLPGPTVKITNFTLKRIDNIIQRIELPEYDTGNLPSELKVKSQQDDLLDLLFGDSNSVQDMILKSILQEILPLFTDLYDSIGGIRAAIQLIGTLKPKIVSGTDPKISKSLDVQVQFNNPAPEDIGRPVEVILSGNDIRGRINTPATALDHVCKLSINNKIINPDKAISGREEFDLPENGLLKGNYTLLGNYGKISFYATFRDHKDRSYRSKNLEVIYAGAFEHELRNFEKKRRKLEKEYIDTIGTEIVNYYLDGVLPLFDSALTLLNQTIGLFEAVPALGGLTSNLLKIIISIIQENLKAEISLAKTALSNFQRVYNEKNDSVRQMNFSIAEKYPEQGKDGERESNG